MQKVFPLVFASVLLILSIPSCTSDSEEDLLAGSDCDTTQLNYTQHIQPIMQANCLSCHSGGTAQGGIELDSYNSVLEYVNNGQLLGSITHSPGFTPMPFNQGKLSECDIARVRNWIEEGTNE